MWIRIRIRLALTSVEENDQEKKDQENRNVLGSKSGSKSESEWGSNQDEDLDKRQVSSAPSFHPLLPHIRELRESVHNNVQVVKLCDIERLISLPDLLFSSMVLSILSYFLKTFHLVWLTFSVVLRMDQDHKGNSLLHRKSTINTKYRYFTIPTTVT